MASIVQDGVVKNPFIDLLQLRRNAATIFEMVENFFENKSFYIKNTTFSMMDECSTMPGNHSGVKRFFQDATPHFTYIHCRNHHLALCFTQLILQYNDFKNFDALLLNLLKAAVTVWSSHGKAAQRILDRYEVLVAALDVIYIRKMEPAVCDVKLVTPTPIATLSC